MTTIANRSTLKSNLPDHSTPPARHVGRWGVVFLLLTLIGMLPGCSRQFWRLQAEQDAYELVEEKQTDELWELPRIDIDPDPRSRFYDPYPLDKGPLPPDDPAAHEYMHQMDWIPGYKSWHQFGEAFSVENPQWYDAFEMTPVRNVFRDQARNKQPSTTAGAVRLVSHDDLVPVPDPLNDVDPADPDRSMNGPKSLEISDDDDDDENVVLRPEIKNLTLMQAIELSQIHSRDYQTEIENVFLEALDLTLSRFQFDVRYLGLGGTPSIGVNQSTNGNGQESRLSITPRAGISQVLPTGGQWAVELANNTLWLFSGDNQTSTSSLLSYSLVQPLMQGAGRKIALASLTQQERNLLYAVRVLARFRQLFFTDVVTSYLSLLQTRQGIINQSNNIIQTENQLERSRVLESFQTREISEPLNLLPNGVEIPPELAPKVFFNDDADILTVKRTITDAELEALRGLSNDINFQRTINAIVDRLNTVTKTLTIVQLETNLASSRNELLGRMVSYQNSLDAYKFQLGLPPDTVLSLDESFLEPFTLIDQRIFGLEREVNEFVHVVGMLDEADPSLDGLRAANKQFGELIEHVRSRGLKLVLDDRQRFLDAEQRIFADKEPEDRERLIYDLERDRRILESTQQKLTGIEQAWKLLQVQLAGDALAGSGRQANDDDPPDPDADDEKDPQAGRRAVRLAIANLREDLLQVTQNLQVIQVAIRVELLELNPFDMDLEESVEYALENRLDLMNARAAVMDARRNVEVAANQLEGVLDVVIEGDIGTKPGTKPFDFRATRSTFRTGLQFTTPLNQISQRNQYRASLIAYQRARRAYMQQEDSVKIQVRQDWRQLKVLKKNFEIQRRAIRSSAIQLDQTIARASDPSQAANLDNQGLNLLNALNAVLNNQNALIGIWINYERNRLNFYQDIGMMEIDSQGIWDDAYYQSWLHSGKPGIGTTSTPTTPQEARRVISAHLRQPGDELDDRRDSRAGESGAILASGGTPTDDEEVEPPRLEPAAARVENRVPAGGVRRGVVRDPLPVVDDEGRKFLPPIRLDD